MRAFTLLVLLLASSPACNHGAHAQLTRLEHRYAGDSARVEGVALDLSRLTVTQRQVIATYVEAKQVWESSQSIYQEAASQSCQGSGVLIASRSAELIALADLVSLP